MTKAYNPLFSKTEAKPEPRKETASSSGAIKLSPYTNKPMKRVLISSYGSKELIPIYFCPDSRASYPIIEK